MTLAIDPVRGAAILLPLFIVQDIVGVWAFRKNVDWRILAWALPGAAVGTFLGWLFAANVAVWVVEAAVGVIAIAFGANRLAAGRGAGAELSRQRPNAVGLFWGGCIGLYQPSGTRGRATVSDLGDEPQSSHATCLSAPARYFLRRSTGSKYRRSWRWVSSRRIMRRSPRSFYRWLLRAPLRAFGWCGAFRPNVFC